MLIIQRGRQNFIEWKGLSITDVRICNGKDFLEDFFDYFLGKKHPNSTILVWLLGRYNPYIKVVDKWLINNVFANFSIPQNPIKTNSAYNYKWSILSHIFSYKKQMALIKKTTKIIVNVDLSSENKIDTLKKLIG